MVKKAENYDFSSARLHLRNDGDSDSASEIITKDIIQTKRKEYREFFYDLEAMDKEHITRVADVVQQEKVLGSEKFIKWVEGKFDACLRIRGRGRPLKRK